MIKRTMIAACLAALAFAALPAIAAAEEVTNNPGDPYLEGLQETEGVLGHFTVSGGVAKLRSGSLTVTCQKVTGTGSFEDKETGSVKFTFDECTGLLNVSCQSGSTSGVIETTTLPFHLKTVDHEDGVHGRKQEPGILITPGAGTIEHSGGIEGDHFATFKCSLAKVVVGGTTGGEVTPGIIGTITSPDEGHESSTATIKFQPVGTTSEQTHRKVTGSEHEYDLKASVAGGETKTASEEAEGTITFTKGTPELLTTPTG